jgi:hypothetical protein
VGEILAGIPPLNIGAGGLIVLMVILFATGKIPTLRELRDSQAREQRAMELAEKWQQVATEQGMTLNRLLDAVETTNHIVTAIQAGLAHSPGEGP